MALHKSLTGAQAVHQSAYVQSTDPGAIGPLKDWYDTTTDPATHKVRNADDDGWIDVGAEGDASAISFAPAGTIAATNVQAAIEEVASEVPAAVPSASETVAGTAQLSDAGEASGGTNDATIMTPKKVKDASDPRYAALSHNHAAADVTSGTFAVARLASGAPDGSKFVRDDGTLAVPSGSGYTPPWVKTGSNVAYAAWADGDPRIITWLPTLGSFQTGSRITGGNVGTTRAILVKFQIPKALSVTNVRVFPLANTTNIFNFGIYDTGGTRLWTSGLFSTTQAVWTNITANTPFSLVANTEYWFAVTAATSATITFDSIATYGFADFWGYATPGPLIGLGAGMPEYAQHSTTSSTMPSSLTSVTTLAAGCGPPIALLVGTAS